MGATVTCGKHAAAFIAPGGRVFFVLFEETYEKNVHPHRPHWSCIGFGTIEDAMRRVFAYGSSCEGGMLQSRGGAIRPEGYIAGWMRELANPTRMPERDVRLSCTDSYASPIPKDKIQDVAALLREARYTDAADAIADGREATLSLHRDADVLARIYGGGALSPWRIIPSYAAPLSAPKDVSLGYAPKAAKAVSIESVEALTVPDMENRLLRRDDGGWYCAGWAYSIVAKFIEAYWRTELAEPGSFKKRIQAFRDAIQGAPSVPDGTLVSIDPAKTAGRWDEDRVKALLSKNLARHTDSGLVAEPVQDALYDLCGLGKDCATWLLPTYAARTSAGVAPHQMNLL